MARVALAALLASGSSAAFAATTDQAVAAASQRSSATAAAQIRIAQAAPQTADTQAAAGVTLVSPGDTMALPKELVDQASATQNYMIVTKAPSWLEMSSAERVGEGVWLISPQNAAATRLTVAAGASGEREIVLTIVDKAGTPVSEARVKLQIAAKPPAPTPAKPPTAGTAKAQPAPAPQATAPAAAPAATQPPSTPAAAAASPAATPAAAPAAAQGQATTANPTAAAAPAGAGTAKTWTDFIAGKKPPPAAKATPQAPVAGGQKPEAELISLAKHLVRECTTCHSIYGEDNGIPLMIGLTKDRFLDTMDLYKTGKRDNVAMQSVAQSLSDEETLALSMYLGRIKPPTQTAARSPAPSAGGVTTDASPAQAVRPPAARLEAGSAQAGRVDRWVERAQQMLERGEIAQARLLLQRGAELGHAQATMSLASTFDPNVLPWRPGMGPEAEPARARTLYQQAIQLGAGGEAERRLSELP